ncbi:sodium/mannose cotransporter SLC5A10-like, partial [Antedon mediterranea]|uniref:sodium/mannose cotransporter SLC5A10-like n=1 Tax=Antedon mediterranea TaxID=105859 RepID=UPI003AF95D99
WFINSLIMSYLHPIDIAIIVIHFCIVFGIGIWSTRGSAKGSASGYFLAGRNMSWWLVGMSIYVSNIGSSSFIGLASTAAANGYAVISYEFSGVTCLALLGFVFTPVYLSSEAYTMPEYLKKRYGGNRVRMYIAVVTLILIVIASISGEMYAGAIIIQQVLEWPLYFSVCLMLGLTAIYTVVGGLKAVIYTDAFQSVIMLFGAFILTILAFIKIGGMENLRNKYMAAIPNTTLLWGNTTCGIPGNDSFHIFRSAKDPAMPWPGVFFGIHILSGWFFCTNQLIVQRSLSAKNLTHAKAGAMMAGYFKILPMFLMIFPGMISRALYPDEVACADPSTCEAVCGVAAGCTNIAYPKLVMELMPTGLRGLMMAAMIAALMSSLTSIFNSASTIFTIDIWPRIRSKASEAELMIVGRVSTVVLVIVSILWLPVVEKYGTGELFVYVQSMVSYFAPPLFATFLIAVFWTRANEQGAFWGLMSALVFGFIRLVLDFTSTPPSCTETDDRPKLIKNFHYLHFACFLFGSTVLVTVIVSLFTKPIPLNKLNGLTFWTKHLNYNGDDTNGKTNTEVTENGAFKENQDIEEMKSEEQKKSIDSNGKNTATKNRGVMYSIGSWLFLVVCGFPLRTLNTNKPRVSHGNRNQDMQVSLYEKPKWIRILNVNLVILIACGIFFYAYYG